MANIGDLYITGIKPVVSTALEASHRLSATGPGVLYDLTVLNTDSTARLILLFDSVALPADGAVTPVFSYPIAALSTTPGAFALAYPVPPLQFVNGLWVCLSTALTTPFTKTIATAVGFFSALVQTG